MDAGFGKIDAAPNVARGLDVGRISRMERTGGDSADVAAREMESLFATMLVSELRKGLGDGFFGEGPGADTFNGWFDEQLGASLASRKSLGLADDIREAIHRENRARAAEIERLAEEGVER